MLRLRHSSLFLVGAVLAVALIGLAKNGSASAASNVLTLSPSSVRPVVDPGSTTTGTFQIINQGQTDYSVRVYAAPYSVEGENYTPDFTALPNKPDVASWLQFSTTQSNIKSNQTLTVHYTLTVPAGTLAGGYYAAAFAETQLPKSSGGVIVNERVGELFYIQVAGPVKQSGKLLSWSSAFFQKPPLAATLRVENDGGVHYLSNVHIVVSDLLGHSKYISDSQKEVLPQTIRRMPVSWTNAPSVGLFKVSGTVSILGKTQNLPTKYVLVMSTLTRIICFIILVVLVVGLAALTVRKRKSKRKPAPSAKG